MDAGWNNTCSACKHNIIVNTCASKEFTQQVHTQWWALFGVCQRKSEVQPAEFIYYKYTCHILANCPHTREQPSEASQFASSHMCDTGTSVSEASNRVGWRVEEAKTKFRTKDEGRPCVWVCMCICLTKRVPDEPNRQANLPYYIIWSITPVSSLFSCWMSNKFNFSIPFSRFLSV